MPSENIFRNDPVGRQGLSPFLIQVHVSDTVDSPYALRQLYVGTGGDVALVDENNNVFVHKNVPDGSYLGPFSISRVNDTGTTASDFVGYP